MAFNLKVTKGAGTGADFPIDQGEARLGRTADNDIVVKDSGASRAHCRVFQKGTRYFVEDLQSANGTKVNNSVINGTSKEVKSGDTISIGEVVFTFSIQDQTMLRAPNANESIETAENQTVLKGPQVDQTAEVPALSTGEAPALTSDEEPFDPNATMLKSPKEIADAKTQARPQLVAKAGDDDGETVPPNRALAKGVAQALNPVDSATMEVKVPVRRGGGAKSDDGDDLELTAADKARRRREASKSTGGRIAYAWSNLGKGARRGLIGAASVLGLALVGLIVWAVIPKKVVKAGPEPQELQAASPTIESSFGLGDGVTYERSDMKVFGFTAASPTRIVGVLHYMAKDIQKDEVAIAINGFDLGFIPPDTLETSNRDIELVLPAQQVKKNDANQIVFDNVHNPPKEDAWRIWNLWLELIAIPDTSPEETINAVKEDLERSQKFYDQRDIGPDNLFKSWKGYRDAWLRMESMTGRPDDLYIVARQQQREIRLMLDRRCSMMELDFQKAMALKRPDRKRAHQILEEMLRYFPTREHPCHGLARSRLDDFGGGL